MKTIKTEKYFDWEGPDGWIEVGDMIVSDVETDHEIENPTFWERKIVGKVLRLYWPGYSTTYVVALTSIGETLFEVSEHTSTQEDDSWRFVQAIPPHEITKQKFEWANEFCQFNTIQ